MKYVMSASCNTRAIPLWFHLLSMVVIYIMGIPGKLYLHTRIFTNVCNLLNINQRESC